MCPLRRAADHETSGGNRRSDSQRWLRSETRLEIEFTWTDDVRQFYPVAPSVYRQLMRAKPMYLFLHRLLASRSLRAQRVRTEAGRVLMMAHELEKLAGSLILRR